MSGRDFIADCEFVDMLVRRFGYEWRQRQILNECRQGIHPKEIARRFGGSDKAVRCVARRAGIRFQKVPEFTFIYALLCPKTKEIRYVGKSDKPEKRLKAQLANPANDLVAEWIVELRGQSLRPVLQVLAKVKYKYWSKAEIALIWKYSRTCDLLNIEGTQMIKRSYRTPLDRILPSLSDQAKPNR